VLDCGSGKTGSSPVIRPTTVLKENKDFLDLMKEQSNKTLCNHKKRRKVSGNEKGVA